MSLFACELTKNKTAYTKYTLCSYSYISTDVPLDVKVILFKGVALFKLSFVWI